MFKYILAIQILLAVFKMFNILDVSWYIILMLFTMSLPVPVLIPLEIHKWSKNRNWRKNVKVGDRCFFINLLEKRSYGNVAAISEDKLKARVERKNFGSSSSGWYEIDSLRVC